MKKKYTKEQEIPTVEENIEAVNENVPEDSAVEENAETLNKHIQEEPAENTDEKSELGSTAISIEIDGILKLFPDHKELYIDKHGGIYTTQSQSCIREGAILYKNPYFK